MELKDIKDELTRLLTGAINMTNMKERINEIISELEAKG
jgi:hypothetical protein